MRLISACPSVRVPACVAVLAAVTVCRGADPGAPGNGDFQGLQARIADLEAKNAASMARIAELERKEDTNWMTRERVDQIKGIVQDVLADARSRAQTAAGWDAGYKDGFYLRQGDAFKLQANGLIDVRYTYARAENVNGNPKAQLAPSASADAAGFSLNTAQFALSGRLFSNVTFKAMANFGSTSSFTAPAAGTFQFTELWAGYSVSDDLNVRAGSLVIPLIPIKTLANYGGSQFPDPSDASVPFAPGYGLGADVYGALAQRFSYDLMVGNGANSQALVDSASPGNGRDNRLSVYNREQFAGSGKLTDFLDEPDLQNHPDFVWITGAGFGFESQNSSASAYPSAQTSTQIAGLSTAPAPGFLSPKYVLDGNLYRAAADLRTKYHGWSTYGQLLYQQVNGQSPVIGGLRSGSVGEFGCFVQSGYFVLPRKLELAARFGELFTLGQPNQMDVYTLGINYYLAGENAKIQLAETFIPNEAAVTDANGSLINTQNYVTELQLQIKY